MKRIITLAVFVMGMMSTALADNHVVSISWDHQCLIDGIPITMTLHLKGFNNNDSIQWQSLQPNNAWGDIANETGKSFTTYTVGIYRAAVRETGGQKDSTYYSPDVCVSACSVMPTTLTSFSGVIKNNAVQLHWATSLEENTSHIDVQQSSDGDYFATVHTVAAAGNSNVTLQYAVALPIPMIKGQTVFYRLKMVDIDGAVKFSATIALNLSNSSVFSKLTVYPNPVTSTLKFLSDEVIGKDFIITTVTGAKILSGKLTGKELNVQLLPPGTYFISLQNGGMTELVKQ